MIYWVVLRLLSLRVAYHLFCLLAALKQHPELLCFVADYLGILLVASRNHDFHLGKLVLQVSSLGVLSQGVGSQVVGEG
jgi:hypothetical protein